MLQHRNLHQISHLCQLYEQQSYDSILSRIHNQNDTQNQPYTLGEGWARKLKIGREEEERDRREPKDVLKHMERKPSRCLLSFAQLRMELVQKIDSDVKHTKIAYDLPCKH